MVFTEQELKPTLLNRSSEQLWQTSSVVTEKGREEERLRLGARFDRCMRCWTDRRGSGKPNLPRDMNISGANGDCYMEKGTLPVSILKNETEQKNIWARKKRRRGREHRHHANVQMLAVDGKHRKVRAAGVPGEYCKAGLDIIYL